MREPDYVCFETNEAVPLERGDGLGIEIGERPGTVGHDAKSVGTPLPERALEPRLLA
jgi:hypothetical protein